MYNMYSYMYNMYINNNYLLLHTVLDFEHIPMSRSVSRNQYKVSSQSEHSTSKA